MALLSNLLSLPADPRYPLPLMSPQRQKEATLATISAMLENMAKALPVLMVFEDVHWIDPTSLDLLASIVERLPSLRVLLVMTARPEFIPPWPGHAHVSTILLTRLSRRDGAALVKRVAGGKPLPDEVLSQILARTDGVPLFVEELTKTVIESGQLQERSDQYVLEQAHPSLAIPTTLHASLMARLDRLAPVRDVAQIGAVIGREFSYELLSAVAGLSKPKLDEALEQLTRSELIFRRGVDSPGGLQLQARFGARRRLRGPFEKPARTAPCCARPCVRTEVSGSRRRAAGNRRASSHRGRLDRTSGALLAACGYPSRATLRPCGSHRASTKRHRCAENFASRA